MVPVEAIQVLPGLTENEYQVCTAMLLEALQNPFKMGLLTMLLSLFLSSCLVRTNQDMVTAEKETPESTQSPSVMDYSQPESVANLFYQLILAREWDDAYSLLTQDSKDATKLGDFIQFWAVNDGRTQLVKVERIGDGLVNDSEARLYFEASYDQVYPKPGSYKTYAVRSLVKEDGAWRIRWRGPEDQSDLGHEVVVNESQQSNGVTITLERIVLLEHSTLVFFRLLNDSSQTLQFDPDLAQLVLSDDRTVPLETVKESGLGLRTLEAGKEREDILFFRALEPTVTEVTFISPQVVLDDENWRFRFSAQF